MNGNILAGKTPRSSFFTVYLIFVVQKGGHVLYAFTVLGRGAGSERGGTLFEGKKYSSLIISSNMTE